MPVRYESIIGLSLHDRSTCRAENTAQSGSHLDKGLIGLPLFDGEGLEL